MAKKCTSQAFLDNLLGTKQSAKHFSFRGICHPKTSVHRESTGKVHFFDPELVTAHCFKQFKQEDFHLPQSRRRVIIVPCKEEQLPVKPKSQPQASPQPMFSIKIPEAKELQEQPLDTKTWLSQRLKLRNELESLGNVERWLKNKPSCTPSEAKVLHGIQREHGVPPVVHLAATRATKKKASRAWRKLVPLLHLPKPPALSTMFSHLHKHKVKIRDMFNRMGQGNNQRISREEFIVALKAVGMPLSNQELEDIVIYLSSLGKFNTITMDILVSTYKQWSMTEPRRSQQATRQSLQSAGCCIIPKSPLKRQTISLTSQPAMMDPLPVPKATLKEEAQHSTLEDIEDVSKRYREMKRLYKHPTDSIYYSELCRLVCSRNKHLNENHLLSTVHGLMGELVNKSRRDTFLAYLQCWNLCVSYGLPLTEDILMKALLHPGDKIIFLKNQTCRIRQPGGYYSDLKPGAPNLSLPRSQENSEAKKTDKKMPKNMKRIHFKEFEELTRKLKVKRPRGQQLTHPNFFWPGHLLDKLKLYLPTVAVDRSLAIFSHVQHQPPVYPAIYHPNHWWPMKNMKYMTCAYYDAPKVYHIN